MLFVFRWVRHRWLLLRVVGVVVGWFDTPNRMFCFSVRFYPLESLDCDIWLNARSMYIRTKVGIACCPAIRPSGGASFNEFIRPLLRPLHSGFIQSWSHLSDEPPRYIVCFIYIICALTAYGVGWVLPIAWVCATIKLLAVYHSARTSMKNAAKCVNWCELQNTLIIDNSNANCGQRFISGCSRLSVG